MQTYQQQPPVNGSASITELRRQSALPAKQMGGSNVAAFFEANKASLAAVIPKHMTPDRLMKVALGAIRTTPALMECTTKSLLGAVVQCAQLGLEPNTVLGHAYLVPFNAKTKVKDPQTSRTEERWTKNVQVIIGYKGLIDLARRSGQIVSIAAHEVCENDQFELVYGLDEKLNHTPAMGERGEIIGFYAVAKLKDGGHCFEFMSRHQIEQIMRASQSKGNSGPWKEHFVEMGRKTVIRRLSKYLPLSIEFATASALDSMAEAGKSQGMEDVLEGNYTVTDPDDAPAVAEDEPGIHGPMSEEAEANHVGAKVIDKSTGEVIPPENERPPIEAYADEHNGYGSAAQAEFFAEVPQEETRPAATGRTRGSRTLD